MICEWCKDCETFTSENNNCRINQHSGHNVIRLGEKLSVTIQCLDDLIQYGKDSIAEMEADVEQARQVEREIQAKKDKFKSTLLNRIEKIVVDLRVALDEQSMELLDDVDRKFEETVVNAQTVARTSRQKLDTANEFLKNVAITLPHDDGTFDQSQLRDIQMSFNSLQQMQKQRKPKLKVAEVNIKFPNTMKLKSQCRELSKQIVGEIEHTARPILLDAHRPSIDVLEIAHFNAETN